MRWTPEEIVQILQAMTPLIVALGTVFSGIAAWKSSSANAHGRVNSDKLDVAVSKVDQVHNCLAEARAETVNAVTAAKEVAIDTNTKVTNMTNGGN